MRFSLTVERYSHKVANAGSNPVAATTGVVEKRYFDGIIGLPVQVRPG